jgi:hypothetical protein
MVAIAIIAWITLVTITQSQIYQLAPLVIIMILIIAAAGLTRGTDIFSLFGIGALFGMTGSIGSKGAGRGFGASNVRGRIASQFKRTGSAMFKTAGKSTKKKFSVTGAYSKYAMKKAQLQSAKLQIIKQQSKLAGAIAQHNRMAGPTGMIPMSVGANAARKAMTRITGTSPLNMKMNEKRAELEQLAQKRGPLSIQEKFRLWKLSQQVYGHGANQQGIGYYMRAVPLIGAPLSWVASGLSVAGVPGARPGLLKRSESEKRKNDKELVNEYERQLLIADPTGAALSQFRQQAQSFASKPKTPPKPEPTYNGPGIPMPLMQYTTYVDSKGKVRSKLANEEEFRRHTQIWWEENIRAQTEFARQRQMEAEAKDAALINYMASRAGVSQNDPVGMQRIAMMKNNFDDMFKEDYERKKELDGLKKELETENTRLRDEREERRKELKSKYDSLQEQLENLKEKVTKEDTQRIEMVKQLKQQLQYADAAVATAKTTGTITSQHAKDAVSMATKKADDDFTKFTSSIDTSHLDKPIGSLEAETQFLNSLKEKSEELKANDRATATIMQDASQKVSDALKNISSNLEPKVISSIDTAGGLVKHSEEVVKIRKSAVEGDQEFSELAYGNLQKSKEAYDARMDFGDDENKTVKRLVAEQAAELQSEKEKAELLINSMRERGYVINQSTYAARQYDEINSEIKNNEDRQRENAAEAAALQKEMANMLSLRSRLQKRIEKSEERLSIARKNLDDMKKMEDETKDREDEIRRTKNDMTLLNHEINRFSTELVDRDRALDDLIKEAEERVEKAKAAAAKSGTQ